MVRGKKNINPIFIGKIIGLVIGFILGYQPLTFLIIDLMSMLDLCTGEGCFVGFILSMLVFPALGFLIGHVADIKLEKKRYGKTNTLLNYIIFGTIIGYFALFFTLWLLESILRLIRINPIILIILHLLIGGGIGALIHQLTKK